MDGRTKRTGVCRGGMVMEFATSHVVIGFGIILGLFLVCILAGMALGAWVHHKGVSVGSGFNPNFIGSPKGEVFSIQDEGDAEYPEAGNTNEAQNHLAKRAGKFMDMFSSRGGE